MTKKDKQFIISALASANSQAQKAERRLREAADEAYALGNGDFDIASDFSADLDAMDSELVNILYKIQNWSRSFKHLTKTYGI